MNFDRDRMEKYDKMVRALYGRGSYNYAPKKLGLDMKNRTTPPAHLSIKQPPVLELKDLPPYLHYAF